MLEEMDILLAGVVGSTAYGLATSASDVDRLGCYAASPIAFWGLHPPQGTHVTIAPDAVYHEAGKLVSLLLKCNPTVTELLWLREYEVRTPAADALLSIRQTFLSAPYVRNAYLGYATQQFTRIRNRGDGSFSADTRKRTAKHARHLWRLLQQGVSLHQTGQLTIRLSSEQVAACRIFGERVEAGDLTLAERALQDAETAFDQPGTLSAAPVPGAAEAWLQYVRREGYLKIQASERDDRI